MMAYEVYREGRLNQLRMALIGKGGKYSKLTAEALVQLIVENL